MMDDKELTVAGLRYQLTNNLVEGYIGVGDSAALESAYSLLEGMIKRSGKGRKSMKEKNVEKRAKKSRKV
jgi:hypothetical protein